MRHKKGIIYRALYSTVFLLATIGLIINLGNTTVAMTADQRRSFELGLPMYDLTSVCGEITSVDGSEVLGFASQPIDSTWGISDSTVEQWFLQQAGAKPVITRYGLNSGNIGSITSAVRSAGVSPVFFFAYTVNEGGGAGGFINHYGKSYYASHGGDTAVNAATGDAQYLAAQSKNMDSNPSWVDAGNPVDFVPQDVKDSGNASFQKMPSGTIGRAYIPATAAATWEVYYPNGLKKEFNKVQNYASPLRDTMNNVRTLGGNPEQGGSSVCPPTASGDIIGIAEQLMGYFTYSQPNRKNVTNGVNLDNITSISDIKRNGQNDCSGFVWLVAKLAGYKVPSNMGWATGSMQTDAKGKHQYLQEIPAAEAKAGDVIIGTNCLSGKDCGHTALLAEDYHGDSTVTIHMTTDSGSTAGVRKGKVAGFSKYSTVTYARLVGKAN